MLGASRLVPTVPPNDGQGMTRTSASYAPSTTSASSATSTAREGKQTRSGLRTPSRVLGAATSTARVLLSAPALAAMRAIMRVCPRWARSRVLEDFRYAQLREEEMVGRDGIEPPTPGFSVQLGTCHGTLHPRSHVSIRILTRRSPPIHDRWRRVTPHGTVQVWGKSRGPLLGLPRPLLLYRRGVRRAPTPMGPKPEEPTNRPFQDKALSLCRPVGDVRHCTLWRRRSCPSAEEERAAR